MFRVWFRFVCYSCNGKQVYLLGIPNKNLVSTKEGQLIYFTSAPNKKILVIPQRNGLLLKWEMPVWLRKHNALFGAGRLHIKYRISTHTEKLSSGEKFSFCVGQVLTSRQDSQFVEKQNLCLS